MLAALGAFMVTMVGVQSAATSQSIISSRVYYAARSGLEWGIHQATAPEAGSGVCAASTDFASPPAGLGGISIRVECSVIRYCNNEKCEKETSTFRINSIASYGSTGNRDYAERKLFSAVCRSTEKEEDEC
jgi:MSHA biogenesis protein MshP